MNRLQGEMLRIVNSALKNEKVKINSGVEWKELFKECRDHQLVPLLNYGLEKEEMKGALEEKDIEKLKLKILRSNIRETEHVFKVSKVLKNLQDSCIPVIVLKGLVVRNLYPRPELRTMSDADILVPLETLGKVSRLMKDMGYRQTKNFEDHGAHIVFKKEGEYPVEVHWTLINNAFFKGNKEFEKELWQDCMDVQVGKVNALGLSVENLAVHLCTHMAVHLAYKGFGLRQLIDLTLLVNNYGNEIDWNRFLSKIKVSGIERFTFTVFNLSSELFGMKIPIEIKARDTIGNEYTKLLLQDIFESGTHGKKDKSRVFASEFAFEQGSGASRDEKAILNKWLKLLFPPVREMGDRYSYAKNCIVLTPIAWIHHIFAGLFNKKYSFFNKYKIATSTIKVANERNKLLKGLNL